MKRSTKITTIITAIFFIGLIINMLAYIVPRLLNSKIENISAWQIASIDYLDGEILWQKAMPCLKITYTTHNGTIAMSENHIVVHDSCIFSGKIKAFELSTGDNSWDYRANTSHQIVWMDDSYLLITGDSLIVKLDANGNKLWQSEKFISRSMRAIHPSESLIYAPYRTSSNTGTHILDFDTGEIIGEIEDPSIIGVFNGLHIRSTDTSIAMINSENNQQIWTNTLPVSKYTSHLNFWNISKVNDVLLVNLNRENIVAYDFNSGDELWRLGKRISSDPIILENKLVGHLA